MKTLLPSALQRLFPTSKSTAPVAHWLERTVILKFLRPKLPTAILQPARIQFDDCVRRLTNRGKIVFQASLQRRLSLSRIRAGIFLSQKSRTTSERVLPAIVSPDECSSWREAHSQAYDPTQHEATVRMQWKRLFRSYAVKLFYFYWYGYVSKVVAA